jgi:hypothetical protein
MIFAPRTKRAAAKQARAAASIWRAAAAGSTGH